MSMRYVVHRSVQAILLRICVCRYLRQPCDNTAVLFSLIHRGHTACNKPLGGAVSVINVRGCWLEPGCKHLDEVAVIAIWLSGASQWACSRIL